MLYCSNFKVVSVPLGRSRSILWILLVKVFLLPLICSLVFFFSDVPNSFTKCREVFEELDLSHASDQDCMNVRYVCEIVSRRAAHLVSAGAATLINKMDFNSVTIGVDGSVYRFHPNFHDLMVEKIGQMVRPKVNVSYHTFVFINQFLSTFSVYFRHPREMSESGGGPFQGG